MDTQVIVIGAGPTGLMLAGELRLTGADVIVLERLAEPSGESRALGFTARTMEEFDQRGLLERFGEVTTSSAGHFGGLPLDFSVLDGVHFSANGIPQWTTERILAEWAEELGADIRRGWDLQDFAADEDGVEVEVLAPDGPHQLRASYLVGCDGGRSTVRRKGGFDFPGSEPTMEMFLADITGIDLEPRPIGRRVSGGMVMNAPLGDGLHRIIACERGTPPAQREERPDFAEAAAAWKRLCGEDIGSATPLWTSSFSDSARQVTAYRRGRVLLAGDAAHIHLPAGGQGLNVGVQDATNLGWKLGATVAGRAPAGLLDTYHDERHPVGARVLMNTQAQGLLYLAGTEVEPMREVMGELMRFEEVNRHLVGMVSGLEIRYATVPDEHPLMGRRMPPRDLDRGGDKTTTLSLLRSGRAVLLDLAGTPALRAVAADRPTHVETVTAALQEPAEDTLLMGVSAVLVRPDGYVAWAGSDVQSLAAEFKRWFGSAA